MYHFRRARLLLQTVFARFVVRRQRRGSERKVLVLFSGKLGDLVCLTSVFHAIFAQKNFSVDAVVNGFGAELYAGNPAISKLYSINEVTPQALAQQHYTHAYIFNPNPEFIALCVRAGIPFLAGVTTPREDFWQRQFDRFLTERYVYRFDRQAVEFYQTMLSAIGVKPEPERRELFPQPADRSAAEQFWKAENLLGQWVCALCLGAGKAYKLWPVKHFAQVADHLVERYGAKILLIGSAGDHPRSQELVGCMRNRDAVIDATGHFKLLELAAVLQRCGLFVSVDTGPLHIAYTMGIPVVDIAGPADGVTQHPIGRYVLLHPECMGNLGEPAVAFHSGSEHEERFRAMAEAVTVEQVTAAICKL